MVGLVHEALRLFRADRMCGRYYSCADWRIPHCEPQPVYLDVLCRLSINFSYNIILWVLVLVCAVVCDG